MKLREEIINTLNDLLTRNFDAAKGYREAANDINELDIRTWLLRNAETRDKFISDLEKAILAGGGTPDRGSSLLGTLHRAWLDLKADISQYDTATVLEECKRGEERALEDYLKVIETQSMSPDLRAMIKSQHDQIEASLENIKKIIPIVK